MNMSDIIYKKRNGEKLSKTEIDWFIEGYTNGKIPDYQISALLMAIWFMKMNKKETYNLTDAMKRSGDVADLSQIDGIKVDKHSTGGVGDKTTLIVAPLAAACGVPIAKMSGRGLGFTGGTVDKMESIPGFQTSLLEKDFIDLVNKNGIAVIGQTAHIAKADKLLYALRDVTATVDNISLITSSVMSKKLASGSDAIVLDVKCGRGAFMHSMKEAVELGNLMVEIGNSANKRTIAVVTDMNQPLGFAIGNSLEVIEAIETLKGKGPKDIIELSLTLAGLMIFLGEKADTVEKGKEMAKSAMETGAGLDKLKVFIKGQNGDESVVDDYSKFPQPKYSMKLISDKEGYVNKLEADCIGLASLYTGAGRSVKNDIIDLSAGIYLHKKEGEYVKKGEKLATIYGCDENKLKNAHQKCKEAFLINSEYQKLEQLVKKIIGI